MKRFGTIVVFVVGVLVGHAATYFYMHRPASQVAQAPAPVSIAKPAEAPAPRVANVKLEQEPLWAYGFTDIAKPDDKAQPQAPPTNKPRPNQDLTEQTKARSVDGSSAQYSLVQIRDLHNVIDWFPADHPKMANVIEHGPTGMGD
ncbi:MAG TPA: hypothetical protein VLV86_06860, partial [Vicinamibacterales bacterium]|nr:hypothetical protein [Vicinamibacterales bacterium]